jgi:hypothetical protein
MVRDDGTTAKLSLESQIMLIGSRKNITSAQADKMFKWLNPGHLPSEGCPSPQRCSGHRDIITRQTFIPIYCLRQMHKWIDHWDRIFCAECRKVSKADFNDGSQKFWDMLPRFFNLPEWANLENEI